MPILLTVFFLLAATSEPANQFARHSNGIDEYKLVTKKPARAVYMHQVTHSHPSAQSC